MSKKRKDKDIHKFSVRLYGDRERDAKSIEFLSNQHSVSLNVVISIAIAEYVEHHGVADIINHLIDDGYNTDKNGTFKNSSRIKEVPRKSVDSKTAKPIKTNQNNSQISSSIPEKKKVDKSLTENKHTSDDEFFNVWDNDDLLTDTD